jgi:hypothetical protein
MKKIITSVVVLIALFFSAQVFGQEYQTKGSGDNSKKMNKKTTTVQTPTTSKDTVVSTQGTGQKTSDPASVNEKSKTINTTTTTKTTTTDPSGQKTGTGGTMTTQPAVKVTGRIIDANGKLIATMDSEGWIRDPNQRVLAQYVNGDYYNKDRVKFGNVKDNEIYNKDGKKIAKIGKDGVITDNSKRMIGKIADDGTVTDSKGVKLGSAPGVDKGVAALIFFFQKPGGSSVTGGKK